MLIIWLLVTPPINLLQRMTLRLVKCQGKGATKYCFFDLFLFYTCYYYAISISTISKYCCERSRQADRRPFTSIAAIIVGDVSPPPAVLKRIIEAGGGYAALYFDDMESFSKFNVIITTPQELNDATRKTIPLESFEIIITPQYILDVLSSDFGPDVRLEDYSLI